jgi:predicted nucleic acid-binding protein
MIVVFDTNVVVEAVFWPKSTARRALSGLALRRFKIAVCQEMVDEYLEITARVGRRLFSQAEPSGALAWISF